MSNKDFDYEYNADPLNSTHSSEGHSMEPPSMPIYSSAPQGSNPNILGLQGDEIVLKFHKSRKTAKKCGKVIMYIGYTLMVLNTLGLLVQLSWIITGRVGPNQL